MGLQWNNDCRCGNEYGKYGDHNANVCDADGNVGEFPAMADRCGRNVWGCSGANAVYAISYGGALRTSDISAVLQEVVSQDGWVAGGPLALIFSHVSGGGSRWVEASGPPITDCTNDPADGLPVLGDNQVLCGNGDIVDNWQCGPNRGGRQRCPPNSPFLCNKQNDCGGGLDPCCETADLCMASKDGIAPCPGRVSPPARKGGRLDVTYSIDTPAATSPVVGDRATGHYPMDAGGAAEEEVESGAVLVQAGSDLALGRGSGAKQLVAVRFPGVDLPVRSFPPPPVVR
jgi:hypothetical protein